MSASGPSGPLVYIIPPSQLIFLQVNAFSFFYIIYVNIVLGLRGWGGGEK